MNVAFAPPPSWAAERRDVALRDEVRLALGHGGLILIVTVLSNVGASSLARPLYMLSAIVFALITRRRSPWLFLTCTLWFWLASAFVRRMLEWRAGYVPSDIVLATPNLMSCVIALEFLTDRHVLRRPGSGYGLVLLGCTTYGLVISLFQGEIVAGAFAAADWILPLFYLFHFLKHTDRVDEARAHLEFFLVISTPILVVYTLNQYLFIPDWDANWLTHSEMGVVAYPLPTGTRPFGTTNTPQFLADWCGVCLVLFACFRNAIMVSVTPFLFVTLAVVQVRSVYISTAVALLAGALMGRGGFGRLALVAAGAGLAAVAGAAIVDPQAILQITERISSFSDLSQDGSAQIRAQIVAQTPAFLEAHPLGAGIGAQGRGLAAGGGGSSNINIDFGPLSVYAALGWVAGSLYIFTILLLLLRAFQIARRSRDPLVHGMTAAALCVAATFPSINIIEFPGVIMWICFGYVLATEAGSQALFHERTLLSVAQGPEAAPSWPPGASA